MDYKQSWANLEQIKGWVCPIDDEGSYFFSFSTDGSVTISYASDDPSLRSLYSQHLRDEQPCGYICSEQSHIFIIYEDQHINIEFDLTLNKLHSFELGYDYFKSEESKALAKKQFFEAVQLLLKKLLFC